MKRIDFRWFLAVFLAALVWVPTASATVDWETGPTLSPDKPPLDVAASVDGKWTFVLTEGGKVDIYSADGKLNDTIPVDPTMNRLAVPGRGEKIILSSSKSKKVQEILVEYVMNIPTAGDPFLGPANAPVEVVVFSDFQ